MNSGYTQKDEVPPNAPEHGRFTVTVYASSSSMTQNSYSEAAFNVGAAIGRRGWVQVNGGGNGLMGACTDGGVSEGGDVDCVILERFVHGHMAQRDKFRKVEITETMQDRRMGLYTRANAFVAVPGGLGTLEEMSEVMSWRQLEWHHRVVVLLNTNGFYNHFMQFLNRAIDEKFIADGMRHCLRIADTAQQVVSIIEAYQPESVHKLSSLSGTADWLPSAKDGLEDAHVDDDVDAAQ